MATRAFLLSREAIKAVAGNEGTFKRGIDVQTSKKMREIDLSGEHLVLGMAKCEGSSPGDVYNVKVQLDPSAPSAKPRAECTCPSAQRGVCKHVVALLLIRAEMIQAQERLKAQERLVAARAESAGKNVLPEDQPPPPPLAVPPPTANEAGPSDVAAVFHPMIANALAAGTALSAEVGGASTSTSGKRVLPDWMRPKTKPEPKASRTKKERASVGGANADIRTMLGSKKRPLEVVAKQPRRQRARRAQIVREDSEESEDGGDDDVMDDVARDDVAPRERPTRRAAMVGRRRLQEVADDEDGEGDVAVRGDATGANVRGFGQTGVAATAAEEPGTLGYDWDAWDEVAANVTREEGQEDDAPPAEPATEPRNEPDRLWDGEEEEARPPVGRASSRRGRRTAEEAPVGRRANQRRTLLEPVDEDESGPAAGADSHGGSLDEEEQARVRHVSGAQGMSRDVPQASGSSMPAERAPAAAPNVRPKKKSLFSVSGWRTSGSIDDFDYEGYRELVPTLPPSESPILSPGPSQATPQEPALNTTSVLESAGRSQTEPVSSQRSQPVESIPADSGPPPLFSEPSEGIPLRLPESVPAEEEAAEPQPAFAGFDVLQAMLSNFNAPRTRRRHRHPTVEAAVLDPPPPRDPPPPEAMAATPPVEVPGLTSPPRRAGSNRPVEVTSQVSPPRTSGPNRTVEVAALLAPTLTAFPQIDGMRTVGAAEGANPAADSRRLSIEEPVAITVRPASQEPRSVIERAPVRLPVDVLSGPSTEAGLVSDIRPKKRKVNFREMLAAM